MRISSSAVSGFATGMRIRDGSGSPAIRRRPRRRPGRAVGLGVERAPALDEVRLEQLELARLALHALLGVGRS